MTSSLLGHLPFVGQIADLVSQIVSAAFIDPTTGLLTRTAYEKFASHAESTGQSLAAAYMDLTGFKAINEKFGHTAGDAALAYWGSQLIWLCDRCYGIPFRMGGDEFVIVFPPTSTRTFEQTVAPMLHCKDFSYNGIDCPFGASVGYSPPSDDLTFREIVRNAETAANVAKSKNDELTKWTADLVPPRVIEERHRCLNCSALLILQVPESRLQGQFVSCPNCGGRLS